MNSSHIACLFHLSESGSRYRVVRGCYMLVMEAGVCLRRRRRWKLVADLLKGKQDLGEA